MGCALLWTEEKEEQGDWAGSGIQPKGVWRGKRNPFSIFKTFYK
jgi:hypothetical protein